jgi:hypothetical protein
MPPRLHKFLLGVLAAALLLGVSVIQRQMVHERDVLGLTRYTELKGAPPILALTTVALGGFRGLISNVLWIRATDLQDADKYFEMVQLADWITKLEPHFTQVWLVQSWNMAYNISVKFKDPEDRWRWVERGIELLRDGGLLYNPNNVLIHRELAWFFQHKMGANLDDAQMYYKQMWANEMSKIFGMEKPDWDKLINPKTPEEKQRADLLRNKYKMDPVFMKKLDEEYGPLEWRLPESSAIYWAAQGLEAAKRNERVIDPNDLITLRRVIYQSMQTSFQRGRLIANQADREFEFGPNLAIIPKVNAAYVQAMDDDAKNRDHIQTAHRNFLRDAVYFLYIYNRKADAQNWFDYLVKTYPNKQLLDFSTNSMPGHMDLDDFAIGRIQDEINDSGRDRTEGIVEGLERQAYESLAVDEDDRYLGMDSMAKKVWQKYEAKISFNEKTKERVGLKPLNEIKGVVLGRLLNGELSPAMAAVLRTKLGLPAVPLPAASGTNTTASAVLPAVTDTNLPAPEPASK